MTQRKLRERSPRLEYLERRETPSTISAAPGHLHALALRPVARPFIAVGTMMHSWLPDAEDDPSFTAPVTGRATALRAFNGQAMVQTNGDAADATLNLRGMRGRTLRINMSVVSSGPEDGPMDISGTFVITGGTRRLKGATGSGTVQASADANGTQAMFRLTGKITF